MPELANISKTDDSTYERTNKICQNWQISHKPMTLLMNGRTKICQHWKISHKPTTLLMNGRTKFTKIAKFLKNQRNYLEMPEKNLPELAKNIHTHVRI